MALTDLINLLLARSFYKKINIIIYGRRLIALSKKDDVVRPIAIGNTLRRLAAKCGNSHIIAKRSADFQLQQLGVRVSGGAEATVHVTGRLFENLPTTNVTFKLNFLMPLTT